MSGAVRRGDLRWWGGVFGGVLLAAALLYAAAFRLPPPGRVFMGYLLNSGDAWGYQAFSRAFAEGGLLIDNPFSDVVREPAFFNLLWFSLGKVQRLTGFPFLVLYYTLGAVAAGLMFWVILRFSREFAGAGVAGRFAFLLASFGGGLGWIAVLFSDELAARLQPLDLFHPEGYPLQSALFVPHFALSIAILGAILLWFWRGVSSGRRTWSIGAAFLTLLLGFFHPYHLVTVGCVAGAWVALEQALVPGRLHRGWVDLGLLALAVFPAALYYRWFFRQPNWEVWGAKNIVRTGGPAAVLLGLGPLILMAGWGMWRLRSGGLDANRRFLLVWSTVGLGLLFSYPLFRFEAKLVEGLVLPLSCLGAGAIFDVGHAESRRRWIAAAVLLLALLPSSAVLVAESLIVTGGRWKNFFPGDWVQGCILSNGQVKLNRYLEANSLAGSLIMAPLSSGRILPGVTDARMFISGSHVTRDWDRRWDTARWFYLQSRQPRERYDLLRQYGATHVWYRSGLGFTFDPKYEPYLEPVFVTSDAGLWRVKS